MRFKRKKEQEKKTHTHPPFLIIVSFSSFYRNFLNLSTTSIMKQYFQRRRWSLVLWSSSPSSTLPSPLSITTRRDKKCKYRYTNKKTNTNTNTSHLYITMRRYKTHFKGSLRPSINSNYLKSRPGSMFFESLNCRNKICFFCVLHINLTEELKESVILVWNKNNGKNAHSLQCYFKVCCKLFGWILELITFVTIIAD